MRAVAGSGETTAESGHSQRRDHHHGHHGHFVRPPQLQPQPRALAPAAAASAPLPPPTPAARSRRRMPAGPSESEPALALASASAAVHTVHVQVPVPVAADPASINMSLRLNISATTNVVAVSTATATTTTTTTAASTATANRQAQADALVAPTSSPAPVTSSVSGLPSPRVRKRKGIAYAKKTSSSREKDSLERQSSGGASASASASGAAAMPVTPPPSSSSSSQAAVFSVSSAVISSTSSTSSLNSTTGGGGGSRGKSPFEKLNTLKMLLDCGHLTPEEYQERKTQIINEMTGTSTTTERKKPSPRRVLQQIMKTVVPHNPPDFSRTPKERAEKLSFDVDTLEWQATSTRVKLDLVPFATGQLRNAYFVEEVHEGDSHLHVAKFSIHPSDPSSYLSDVEMQAVCAHYAELYNEHEPPLKVYYARSWLLKLKDRGDLVCSVEEYLPGAYVKYSNNNGYVGRETSTTEERERNTPHAFSHFTFVASDYRLMIVDIQGVQDSYTDPQIHTADGRGFGAGNLGTFGMEKFLETHRCNEVCRWLGLKSINKEYKPGGTAAPEYQMPFGEKIKKSTNPITEERNTFSRSVTVSEAFGGSEMLQAALQEEESFSSSVSTSATGSSSLMYGQAMLQPFLPSLDGKLPVESRPPLIRLSSHGRSGKSVRDDNESSVFWLFLKRLLCCCW